LGRGEGGGGACVDGAIALGTSFVYGVKLM